MSLTDNLVDLCAKKHYTDSDLDLTFTIDKQKMQNPYSVLYNNKPSQCILFSVICNGFDKVRGEKVEIIYDLLNIPDTSDLLMINGGNKQVIEEQRSSSGWYVSKESKSGSSICSIRFKKSGDKRDSSVLNIREDFHKSNSSVVNQTISNLGYEVQRPIYAIFRVNHKIEGERTYKSVEVKCELGLFLVAITGKSYSTLIEEIGNYCSLPAMFAKDYQCDVSREVAVTEIYNKFIARANDPNLKNIVISFDSMYDELFVRSFQDKNRKLDSSAKSRFINNNSFKTRALGMVLAEEIEVVAPYGGEFVKKKLAVETFLDEETLDIIDYNEIDTLKVRYGNKIYVLKKYSDFKFRGLGKIVVEDVVDQKNGFIIVPRNTVLTEKELDRLNDTDISSIKIKEEGHTRNLTRRTELTDFDERDMMLCLNIFFNAMDGYPYIDNEYSMENRKFVSVETSVYNAAEFWLDDVIAQILNNYKNNSTDLKLTTAMQLVVTEPNYLLDNFNSSANRFVQTANITNPLAVQMNRVKTDMLGTRFSETMRSIAPMSQGRIDPVVTPESSKVGIVLYRTVVSDLNSRGEVVTPFIEIENGMAKSSQPVYLSALEERDKYVIPFDESCFTIDADGNQVMKDFVYAKHNDRTVKVHPSKVTLQDYSSFQTCCIARALVPFRQCLAAKRQTMAANHQMQCLYTLKNERPIVGTGAESIEPSWKVTAREILEEFYVNNNLEGHGVDKKTFLDSYIRIRNFEENLGSRRIIFTVSGFPQYLIEKDIMFMKHSDKMSIYSTRLNTQKDRLEYHGNDIVYYDIFYDINKYDKEVYGSFGYQEISDDGFESGLGLGTNLTVCYKTYEGSTIDDAIVINERLIGDGIFTSVNLYKVEYRLNNRPNSDKEEIFGIHPDLDSSSLKGITTVGVPEIGTYLNSGDVVIAKYEVHTTQGVNGKESTILRETNVRMSAVEEGEVVYSSVIDGVATVLIASLQAIEVGDKLTGRHGNKGVVGKIVPSHLMPFADDGTVIDIILNPLGVPSRSNISQIFEAVIGMALRRKGKIGIIGGKINPLDLARQLCEETDLAPMRLRDGRTGQYFKRAMNVGVLYMLRSEHLVSHKINSLGFPDKVDGITCQPQKGRSVKGGNAIGEMEMDILRAADCTKLHDAVMSYYSSDVNTRSKVKNSIMSNPLSLQIEGTNDNNRFMETLFKPFGIKVITKDDAYIYRILTDEDVRKLAPRPIDLTDPANSLRDAKIFGTVASMKTRMKLREQWGYIDLGCDMVNPFFVSKGIISDLITIKVNGNQITGHVTYLTRLLEGVDSFDVVKVVDSNGVEKETVEYYTNSNATVESTNKSNRKSAQHVKPKGRYYGIDGIVKLLQISDINDTIHYYERDINKTNESIIKLYEQNDIPADATYDEALSKLSEKDQSSLFNKISSLEDYKKKLSYVKAFVDSGMKLTDMIFRNYPVLPIIYRPEPRQGRYQDYDEFYKDICAAVSDSKISNSIESRTRIYKAIQYLTGVIDSTEAPKNRTPILTKMTGTARTSSNISAESHGVMRDDLGRRRVTNSGRSVIVPAADINMDMLHVGIPELMAVDMWNYHLASYINAKYNTDNSDGSRYYDISDKQWINFMVDVVSGSIDDTNYERVANKNIAKLISPSIFMKEMHDFIEGNPDKGLEPQIVIFGRQPSFLINSARAYYVSLVKGKAIHIHPLVCKAYNADFDGDQMWIMAVLDDDCKEEAISKMSYREHMLSSKDLSVLVDPQQDIRAGCYIATMLKDNRLDLNDEVYSLDNVRYYDDIKLMEQDIKVGILETYNLVCYTHTNGYKYLSTAGRILFNSLLPNGFTEDEFANVLNIPVISETNNIGINLTGYKQLKYDGLLSKNKGNTHGLHYESLADAVYSIVGNDDCTEDDKVVIMQKILQFGLYFSDIYGLSFTLEDLEPNPKKDLYVQAAKDACKQVEDDFNNGLIPEKIKTESIIEINNACTKKFTNVLVDEMPRTNNMFIMLDSGARGNKTQVNQAVGIIGVLSKNKTEKLDMPIYSNFSEGLSELEQYGSSYAGRMGINSTQNETAETGEMLRKATFLASTVVIQEDDCGRDENADDMYIKLYYTDLQTVNRIDEDETKPDYEWESVPSDLDDILNYELSDNGEWFDVHFKNFIKNNHLTREALQLIIKYKVTLIKCEGCKFILRYKLSDMSKTQLLYRKAFALPYMIDGEYISEETIKYIEDNNLKDIRVRTVFGCNSKNGVCAKCYGLLYTNRRLPSKGSNVAIESAQDIGESASQLTLDVVHSLGTKGGELSSGVKFLGSLLECSTSSFNGKVYCGEGDYVKVDSIGNFSLLTIGESYTMQMSKQNSEVINGEYVDKYAQLSKGLVNPNQIGTGLTIEDIIERQYAMLKLYYDAYAANGIYIMARHFEILVRGQGSVGIATEDKGEYKAGFKYNLQELMENDVPFRGIMVSGDEAVRVNGGPMTALTTGDALSTMKVAFLSQVKDRNNSSKGKTLVGENLDNPKRVSVSIETDLGDKNLNAFNKYSPEVSKAAPKPNVSSMLSRRTRTVTDTKQPVEEIKPNKIEELIPEAVVDIESVEEPIVIIENVTEPIVIEEHDDSKSKKMSLF